MALVPLPGLSSAHADSPILPADTTRIRSLIDDGRYLEAQAAARDLVSRTKSVHGSDSLEGAEALDLLVEARWHGENLDEEALDQARRAVAIKETRFHAADGRLAISLDNLGRVLVMRGDFASARPICERGVALAEKAFGPEDPALARSLSTLGDLLYYADGDFPGSLKLYERALAIREKSLGTEHPEVARALWDMAACAWGRGEAQAATAALERALAIQEKALRVGHPDTADTQDMLDNIARDFREKAESDGARARSRDIAEHGVPSDRRLATILYGFAWGEISYKGDYVEAKRHLERAVDIDERVYGMGSRQAAFAEGLLGSALTSLGDYEEAERRLGHALESLERIRGPEHDEVRWVLGLLGRLHRARGDNVQSSRDYTRALPIAEKTHGAQSEPVAVILLFLGQNSHALGKYAEAEALYRRALQVYEKLAPEGDSVGWALVNIADALRDQGRVDEATPMYERALAIRERIWGPSHPVTAWNLTHFARALVRGGDAPRGFALALRAEEISRDHLRLMARSLPERQALDYAAVRFTGLDLALSVAVREAERGVAAQAWDALIRSRALILEEMAGRLRAVIESGDPETDSSYVNLKTARQELADLTIRGPGRDSPERYRALLDAARGRKDRAEESLATQSLAFRGRRARNLAGLADVRSALPPGSALLAFARYLERDPDLRLRGDDETVPYYAAFIMSAGEREIRMVGLGPARETDALANRWAEQIARAGGGRSSKESDVNGRAAGAALRRRVWDPIASRLGRPERVFVVRDGSLLRVNLSALPVEGGRSLVETGPLIQYLSTERDLVPGAPQDKKGQGILALGGVAFDDASASKATTAAFSRGRRSTCGDFRSMRFEPLPDSEREANDVVALWKESREPDRAGLSLTGGRASETAFKGLAPGRRVIHLATHGFYVGGACASAPNAAGAPAGVLSGDSTLPPPAFGENPLLLSGLALAGANRRASAGPGEDDGILTAEEIAAMDLSGVEWVVLSACDTGAGEFKSGEGIFGLQRAFQLAGARTVISSLWSVEDDVTRAWMRDLYKARLGGASTAAAVRDASLKMIDSLKRSGLAPSPYFWGSFVAVGD